MAFERRINLLLCLPRESLGKLAIKKEVDRTKMNPSVGRGCRWIAEFLGTALLVAVVVGSGIIAERLSTGNAAFAPLASTLATGPALVALILTFGPISGAHFNPVVSLADAMEGGLSWSETLRYILAQTLGASVGRCWHMRCSRTPWFRCLIDFAAGHLSF